MMTTIKIIEITHKKTGKKKDGSDYTLSTFTGLTADDKPVTLKTFHSPLEMGHAYEGEIMTVDNPKWIRTFNINHEIIEGEAPTTSNYTATYSPQPIYHEKVSLENWLYAVELAVRLYERDTTQKIGYQDIIDTAKKWLNAKP